MSGWKWYAALRTLPEQRETLAILREAVEEEGDHWVWLGATDSAGRPLLKWRTPDGTYYKAMAARVADACLNNRVPHNRADVFLRRCQREGCINPAHHHWVSRAQQSRWVAGHGLARVWERACRNGHARTPETTRAMAGRGLRCLICARANNRRRRERQAGTLREVAA